MTGTADGWRSTGTSSSDATQAFTADWIIIVRQKPLSNQKSRVDKTNSRWRHVSVWCNNLFLMVKSVVFASQSQSRFILCVTGSSGGGWLSFLVELQESWFLYHHGNGAFVAARIFQGRQGLFLWSFGGVRLPEKNNNNLLGLQHSGKLSYLVSG